MHGLRVVLACRVAAGGGRAVAGGNWLAGQASPPTSPSKAPNASVDRSEAPMSKRTRALLLAVTLTAMNLAGMTGIARA